ncbi:MAG: sensor histidine kinase [Lachnospiraceae bacterium]
MRKYNTISLRLFGSYALVFILLLGTLSFVMAAEIKQLMIQQFGEERIEVLKQIGERSNSINNASLTVSSLIAYDITLVDVLAAQSVSDLDVNNLYSYLNSKKADYDQVFNDISFRFEVVVIGDNGFCYSSRAGSDYDFEAMKKQLWYSELLERTDNTVYITSFNDRFSTTDDPNDKRYVFSVARNVFNDSGEKIGRLLINVDEQLLFSLSSMSAEGEDNIYIVDDGGKVVSHKEKSSLGMNFINMEQFQKLYGFNNATVVEKLGEEYLLCSHRNTQTGWLIISEVPLRVIFQVLDHAYLVVLTVLFCGLAVSLFLSALISRSISNPLKHLCKSMEEMQYGHFDDLENRHGYVEIEQLQSSFHKMGGDILHLMEEVRIRESNKRKAELDCLRAQINPHFLYNTLFSIRCLIETDQNKKAATMMSSFIALLKKTLSTNIALLPLSGEMETCQAYMQLQSFRYGSKVVMETDIDENVLDFMVPPLILQPIIENALFHGLEPKPEGGTIVVESYADSGILYISVHDDGVGMEEDTIKRLQTQKYQPVTDSGNIGVANVNNRIKINFGKRYGINIKSKIGEGTTVTLRLPQIHRHQYEGREESEYTDCR